MASEAVESATSLGRTHQNRFVAPDIKRRQLIFDSFNKLKQNNKQDQRQGALAVSGAKGERASFSLALSLALPLSTRRPHARASEN
jgi:hypothetical protein